MSTEVICCEAVPCSKCMCFYLSFVSPSPRPFHLHVILSPLLSSPWCVCVFVLSWLILHNCQIKFVLPCAINYSILLIAGVHNCVQARPNTQHSYTLPQTITAHTGWGEATNRLTVQMKAEINRREASGAYQIPRRSTACACFMMCFNLSLVSWALSVCPYMLISFT